MSRLACAVAMAAAGLLYLGSLTNPFVYDDFRVVVNNPSLEHLTAIRGLLLADASRPLVNLSYALDRAVWGAGPFGFHLTNVVLHVINVGLLFVLAFRLAADGFGAGERRQQRWRLAGFATAGFFAVHPVLSQTVAYVSSRPELLCTTFFLLAFLAARQSILSPGDRRWTIATIALWVCAVGSKEVAAVFPVVLFWYERLFFAGEAAERRARLWRLHAPLFGLAVLAAAVRLGVFLFIEETSAGASPQWQFALLEFDAVRLYLSLALLVHDQSVFHDVPMIAGLFDVRAVTGALTVAGVVGVAVWFRSSRRLIALGFVWFLLALVPAAVLVVLDRGEPMAEHRVYLACCGLFLAAGAAVSRLANYVVRPVLKLTVRVAFSVLLLVMSGLTVLRVGVWSDPVALWSEATLHAPNHWLPLVPLGEALHNEGRHDEAIEVFRSAVALRPGAADTLARLGVCLSETGRLDEATAVFEQAIEADSRSPEARNGLATVALISGRPEVARLRYLESLAIDPANVQARRGLIVLAETIDNDPAEALRLCLEIEALAPGSPGTGECIGRNRERLGGGS